MPVRAATPWPPPPPGQDPYRYEDYCYSESPPDDYLPTDGDYWKYTSQGASTLYHLLLSLFLPDCYRRELEGVMGASVDEAWKITTGRPDVVIAVLDSGVRWNDPGIMRDLAGKIYLNPGELPPPQGADRWDVNGDGVFNLEDYQGDPRVADLNGNGLLDPEDLIWAFSDGEDNDGNGYQDDISGWDFLEDDNDPRDEADFGHGGAECAWAAGEADNGEGIPGTCPNAMLLVVRVGDSFIVDVNRFAQGVVFAVDSGARVVLEALGTVNVSSFGQAAVDYAWSRGVAVIASAADEESAHQNYPSTYERTVQVNAVQKYADPGCFLLRQFPPSYLYLGGLTNYGAHTHISVPSDGHSSGATGRLAGIAALVYSAAEDRVRKGDLWPYPGMETPLSACEVKQLLTMTADDIDFSPGEHRVSLGLLDGLVGPSRRFPSGPGWDPYFGYGRVNARRAVQAVAEGRIPPEAEIRSPRWFELRDPNEVELEIVGRVAAVRADSYSYTVEWGPGWNPSEGEWATVGGADFRFEPLEGVLATLDLGEVYRLVQESIPRRGGEVDPNRYAFTVRVRVRDDRGNWGEDRKTLFCFHDPDAYPGAPIRVGGDLSASPRLADLDDDGTDELIVATGDGEVHAFRADFTELQGWPVHTTPLPLHLESEGFASGALPKTVFASITGTPAVGDLDGDGRLEVVAGDVLGRIYAWNGSGELLPGFPVRSNPLYSIPDRADWWTEGALPAEWYASRVVPDRVHRLDRWNCLDRGFLRGPVLADLDVPPDGRLEVIAACLDQHLYAWHADGSPVEGWPVKLADPGRVARLDPLTHTCTFREQEKVPRGSKIVTNPSVADLDADGEPEVICGTNEAYTDEAAWVSAETFLLSLVLPILGPFLDGAAGGRFRPGNTRVYAVYRRGATHPREDGSLPGEGEVPSNAYLPGWPAKLAMVAPGMLPNVVEGVNGPAAVADVDGDGKLEVGVASAAGPPYILKADGSSFLGADALGMPRSLDCDRLGAGSESSDAPVMCALGGGCFARLEGNGICYVAPTMGMGRALDLFFPAEQVRSDDQLSAWRCKDGRMLSSFPRRVNDMMFFVTPGAADIDGDGVQEILVGSSYYDLHAFKPGGGEVRGWPKFTGGWTVATPAVGDLDGDGKREVVCGTREGWLLVWRTGSRVGDPADWPEYGHDPWNTGCLETDARRPGRVTDLAAEPVVEDGHLAGVKLTWTAPGDDGRLGRAMCYEVRCLKGSPEGEDWNVNWAEALPLMEGKPLPAEPGAAEEMFIPWEMLCRLLGLSGGGEGAVEVCFALQARDEAGNVSPLSNVACISFLR
ncbi:MAG: FG-GAP-like repeat-containing protein [Actinomycetota bacterium]|nr:FG-GAP-like repeat-containing protein [Actinomycetota bacterium]